VVGLDFNLFFLGRQEFFVVGLLMMQTYFLGKFKAMDKFMDQKTKLIGLKKAEDNDAME